VTNGVAKAMEILAFTRLNKADKRFSAIAFQDYDACRTENEVLDAAQERPTRARQSLILDHRAQANQRITFHF
jgi:hypothetical protein